MQLRVEFPGRRRADRSAAAPALDIHAGNGMFQNSGDRGRSGVTAWIAPWRQARSGDCKSCTLQILRNALSRWLGRF